MQRIADEEAGVPAEIALAPDDAEILPGADLYWEAFWTLIADRAPASLFGPPGAIPWATIDAYARRLGLAEDAFFDFANAVRELDREYLAVVLEEFAKRKK